MQALEINVNEPMQEYVQYASIIKAILKFRHQKHIQSESTADQLEAKRSSLENLERMETEAKRIESALNKGERSGSGSSQTNSNNNTTSGTTARNETAILNDDDHSISEEGTFTNEPESIRSSTENGDEAADFNPYARTSSTSAPKAAGTDSNEHVDTTANPYAQLPPANPYAHTHSPPSSGAVKRRSTRLNVFSALSHTLHSIVDVDPEATRRNNIGKTRDAIVQVSPLHVWYWVLSLDRHFLFPSPPEVLTSLIYLFFWYMAY